jgi:hypothetical protein
MLVWSRSGRPGPVAAANLSGPVPECTQGPGPVERCRKAYRFSRRSPVLYTV